jgi:hypothetical protein
MEGTGMYYGERFNAVSHLIAAVPALLGAAVLVVLAALRGDVWKVASFAIYGPRAILPLLGRYNRIDRAIRFMCASAQTKDAFVGIL